MVSAVTSGVRRLVRVGQTAAQTFAIVLCLPTFAWSISGPATGLPINGPFNGYLNQLNIVEILNHDIASPAEIRVKLFDNSGSLINSRDIDIPAGGAQQVVANEFRDNAGRGIEDRYGLVRIEARNGSPKVSARTLFYRLPAGHETPEYGFAISFEEPEKGISYGMYNSINPGVGGAVFNYITIANPGTQTLTGSLEIYRQDGTLLNRYPLAIAASGRTDFPAGFPNMATGIFQIVPDDLQQPYISYVARYSAADVQATSYQFAFSLRNGLRGCNEPLPASTMGYGTHNWVEIGNAGLLPSTLTIEVRNRAGMLVSIEERTVAARSQSNFYVNPHIGEQNVGSVKVLCKDTDQLLVQSAFYSRASADAGDVSAAYVSQARGISTALLNDQLSLPVNTYLGDHLAANWLKISNEAAQSGQVTIVVRSALGAEARSMQQTIRPNGTLDIDIHSIVGQDFVGVVDVIPATNGLKLRAELVRVFVDAAGQIVKVIPVPAAFISGAPLACRSERFLWNVWRASNVTPFDMSGAPDIQENRVELVNMAWHGALPTVQDDTQGNRDRLNWVRAPYVSQNGKLIINGGTPIRADVAAHRANMERTIASAYPENFDGYFVIDWEIWWPQWEYQASNTEMKNLAYQQVREEFPQLTENEVQALTPQLWEERGVKLFVETVRGIRAVRPKAKISWYELINRAYWQSYDSTNGDALRSLNDRLLPVFRELDFIIMSVYQFYSSGVDAQGWPYPNGSASVQWPDTYFEANRRYVYNNIREAQRIAAKVGGKKVMAYAWPRYHNSAHQNFRFRTVRRPELFVQLIYPLLLGADFVTVWGSEDLALQNSTFGTMQSLLTSEMGPMTRAYCDDDLSPQQPIMAQLP